MLLFLLLLRELGRGELLVRSGRPLPTLLPRLPLPAHHCMHCDVVSRESLQRSAPIRNPLVFPDLRIEEQGRIIEPAVGRAALVAGLGDLALASLPARSQAVESVVDGTCLSRCPPACGRVAFALVRCHGETSRCLRTATGLAGIALGVTGCDLLLATGLDRSVHDPVLSGRSPVTVRGHAIPLTASGHGCGCLFPLTVHGQWIKVGEPDVSNRRVWRQ